MTSSVILDTGPLVAYLDRNDRFHHWAVAQLDDTEPPLLTCESVLSEACFLLSRAGVGGDVIVRLVSDGLISMAFRLEEEASAIGDLMRRYADLPMSLADACLVRMAEQHSDSTVLTLDRHFRIYRKHARRVIPTIMPGE